MYLFRMAREVVEVRSTMSPSYGHRSSVLKASHQSAVITIIAATQLSKMCVHEVVVAQVTDFAHRKNKLRMKSAKPPDAANVIRRIDWSKNAFVRRR